MSKESKTLLETNRQRQRDGGRDRSTERRRDEGRVRRSKTHKSVNITE